MSETTGTIPQISPEIEAMIEIDRRFASLDDETRARVLSWVATKYALNNGADPVVKPPFGKSTAAEQSSANGDKSFGYQTIAELFSYLSPKSEHDKALVVAYWVQVVQDAPSFDSMQINTELKHLGHGVSNITKAFNALIKSKPALVIQLQKSGKSQQARKKYKVTTEGVRRVREMFASAQNEA